MNERGRGKMKKKIKLPIILTLVMVILLSVMPITVYAADPIEIDSISATITEPVAGSKPTYTASSGDIEKYTVELDFWLDGQGWKVEPDSVFEEGMYYRAHVTFIPNEGYVFTEQPIVMINERTTVGFLEYDGEDTKSYGILFPEPIVYNITTSVNGGNGTISESKSNLIEGTSQTIVFTPDEDYEIDKVTVNGIEIPVSENILELMMDEDKTVEVTYKKISVSEKYAITVENGSATPNTAQLNETVNVTASVPEGKEFVNWTSEDGLIFADANSPTTSFLMPAQAVTVKANLKDLAPVKTNLAFISPFAASDAASEWIQGTATGITLEVNGEAANLTKVAVAGNELVKDTDYSVTSGSSIITLLPAYLETLAPGTYEVVLTYSEGASIGAGSLKNEIVIKVATVSAPSQPQETKNLTPTETVKATVKQEALPKTGETLSNNILVGSLLMAMGVCLIILKNKQKHEKN